jgi:hypothetical protein
VPDRVNVLGTGGEGATEGGGGLSNRESMDTIPTNPELLLLLLLLLLPPCYSKYSNISMSLVLQNELDRDYIFRLCKEIKLIRQSKIDWSV